MPRQSKRVKTKKTPSETTTRVVPETTRRRTLGIMVGQDVNQGSPWWDGAILAARAHHANLIVFPAGHVWRPWTMRQTLHLLAGAERLDGLILVQWWPDQKTFELSYEQYYKPLPVVNFQRWYPHTPGVMANNYQGTLDEVQHLINEHGMRRIAFIRGPEGIPSADHRYNAYLDGLAEAGIEFDPALVFLGDFSDDSGLAAVQAFLDERGLQPGKDFEAILAANDVMALSAMKLLQQRGIRVPYDLPVLGFDDQFEASVSLPPLTTAKLPNSEMGYKATEMLLAMLDGQDVPDQVSVPSQMVVRQSCGCPSPMVRAVAMAEGVLSLVESGPSDIAAFEKCLTPRRDVICMMVANSLGVAGKKMPSGWAEALLDAFVDDVCHEAPNNPFITMFYEVLRQLSLLNVGVISGHNVLSMLRRQIAPCLPVGLTRRTEDLMQQGRVLVQEIGEQLQYLACSERLTYAGILREVGFALLKTFTLEGQMDILPHELEKLNISACYLSLYVNPDAPQDKSKLLLAYDERGRMTLPEDACIFPSRQLVPDSLWFEDHDRCLIIEPLHFQDIPLGFVLFELGPDDVEVYTTLSRQISVALYGALLNRERTRLMEESQSRAMQFRTAAEVARAASSILDLDVLLSQTVNLVRERFGLHYVGLFLVEELNKRAVLRAATGETGEHLLAQGQTITIDGNSRIGQCLSSGTVHITMNAAEESPQLESTLLPGARSELVMPLISRGETLGALTIQSERLDAFNEDAVTVLQTMADQLSNAISNAQLYGAVLHEQSLMNSLMENVPDHIYFKDLQSRFVRISASLQAKFGLEKQSDIVGKTDFDFFTEEHARPAYEIEQEIIRTRQPVLGIEERETWMDRADSWVLTDKLPLYNEYGVVVGTFGISRDITVLKAVESRLAEERNLLRTLIDTLPDAVFVKDSESHFLLANAVQLQILKVKSHDEIFGKTDFDFFPTETATEHYLEDRRLMASGEALRNVEASVDIPNRDELIWVSYSKVPLRDTEGHLIGFVGLTRDITDLKKTEAALERRNLLLQTSTEVSRLSDIFLAQDMLFPQVVDLLHDRLNLYYVGLFLLDGPQLVLKAGSGDVGKQLLSQNYLLRMGESAPPIQAVTQLDVCLVEDIDPVVRQRAYPHLPATRSELALPLTVRGVALGALTFQSEYPHGFTPEDVAVLRTIADQLASAVENLRLLMQTQTTLEEMEATQRRYQQQTWSTYLDTAQITRYETKSSGEPLTETALLPEVEQAVDRRQTLALKGTDDEHAALVVPITLRDQVIGVLGIHDENQDREWTSDDVALVEAVAERMGQAMETLRLLDETQRSAARDRLTSSVANQMRASLDVETVLQTAARAIGDAMGLHDLTIELESQDND
ncbi:MAG: GAF domain-containing protein [Anaerolineae bacterium]|nr:GAF domain-containing protein [Anaerolineae bacterium]